MSNAKPFQAGDKVTTAGGARCVVVLDQHAGQPVHIETAPGVEPYRTAYVPAESLTRGHRRTKAETPAEESPNPESVGAGYPEEEQRDDETGADA